MGLRGRGARAVGTVAGRGRAAALRDVTHPRGSPCSGARAGGEAAAVRPASICVGAFTPWDGLRWAPSAPNGDGRGGSLCRAPGPGCGKDAAPLCPPPTPGKPRVWLWLGSRQPLELCGEGEARAGVGQRGRGSTIGARRAAAVPLAALGAVGVPAEGAPGQRFLLLSCFPCSGFLLDPGQSCELQGGGEEDVGLGKGSGLAWGCQGTPEPPGACGGGGELGLVSLPGCARLRAPTRQDGCWGLVPVPTGGTGIGWAGGVCTGGGQPPHPRGWCGIGVQGAVLTPAFAAPSVGSPSCPHALPDPHMDTEAQDGAEVQDGAEALSEGCSLAEVSEGRGWGLGECPRG